MSAERIQTPLVYTRTISFVCTSKCFPEFLGLHTFWRYGYACTLFSLEGAHGQFSAYVQARQSLIVRGLFPLLADPRHPVSFLLFSLSIFFLSDSVFEFEYKFIVISLFIY